DAFSPRPGSARQSEVVMLETTRAASYIPGSNLRGRTAGPAWLFLLPSLAPERIVCLGAPAPQVLSALAQLGGRMTVLCAGAREERRVRGTCARLGLENVTVGQARGADVLAGEADLLVLGSRPARRLRKLGG